MTRQSWRVTGVLRAGVLAASLLAACGDDRPANVAGDYTLNLTNGNNGCNFSLFNTGASVSNVSLNMDQDAHSVTGTVTGGAGTLLNGLLGSSRFEGSVDEKRVHMEIVGSRAGSQGNCAFTVNATLSAVAEGDFLEGTIEYTRVDNGNLDCQPLADCVTVQSFNGARAPQ